MKDFRHYCISLLWRVSKVSTKDGADSYTKSDIVTQKHQKHLDYLWFISSPLSLSLLLFLFYQPVALYHSAVTSFHPPLPLFLPTSVLLTRLKVISKAVFAGLLLLIKSWSSSSSLGWWLRPRAMRERQCARKDRPDLRVRFNTHQWLLDSCTSPQISTGKDTLDAPTDSC